MNNSDIVTPENTKFIAEWMKENTYIRVLIGTDAIVYSRTSRVEYNLITNSDQSREVEKKLLNNCEWTPRHINGKWFMRRFSDDLLVEAETLELAIYKAALYEAKK